MNASRCHDPAGAVLAAIRRFRSSLLPAAVAAACLSPARPALAQVLPHIGYIYPAGGQQGATFEVAIGGQYLTGVDAVHVSGGGVEAAIVSHLKPLTQQQQNRLRQKLQEIQQQLQEERRQGPRRGPLAQRGVFLQAAEELGLSLEDVMTFLEQRKQAADPKRQLNPQLAEVVKLRVTLDPQAAVGPREVRLVTPSGLSNPLVFHLGGLPEIAEEEPNQGSSVNEIPLPLPAVVNGQILPGDADRFAFQARRGQHLVVSVQARQLIPYLADAVPGWFQSVVAVRDPAGREIAFADDFRFHPDPLLHLEIPDDGEYCLEIRDAVFRGREDFVYRITIGELPYVTGIFPLGARSGQPAELELDGWNLPQERFSLTLEAREAAVMVFSIEAAGQASASNDLLLAVDALPTCRDVEPEGASEAAQRVELPVAIDGRIDRAGDVDVFRFSCRAGCEVVAEVLARRLNSPLDSVLAVVDAEGRILASNDDCKDLASGLLTHHADSRLSFVAPRDGDYEVRLRDAQGRGGREFAYRLRVSLPRPDFDLRIVPSSISMGAGQTVPLTVYALRKDGFAGDILLALKDAPPGFRLDGNWIPAGQDRIRVTLTAPSEPLEEPISLQLDGYAKIGGTEVRRPAVPAEDMMQAFYYQHLVPAQELVAMVTEGGRMRVTPRLLERGPILIPAGGAATFRLAVPMGLLSSRIELVLSDPPEGLAIEDVSIGRDGIAVAVRAGSEVPVGLKGNLIVEAALKKAAGLAGKSPASGPRAILATLPAVRFAVVAANAAPP